MNRIATIEIKYTNYTETAFVYAGQEAEVEALKNLPDFVSMKVIEGELPKKEESIKLTSGQRRRVNTYFKKWSRKNQVEELISEEELKDYEEKNIWKIRDWKKELKKLSDFVWFKTEGFTEEMFAELCALGFSDACLSYEDFIG